MRVVDALVADLQGCGIVEFESADQAQKSIQLFNGTQVKFMSTPQPTCLLHRLHADLYTLSLMLSGGLSDCCVFLDRA